MEEDVLHVSFDHGESITSKSLIVLNFSALARCFVSLHGGMNQVARLCLESEVQNVEI